MFKVLEYGSEQASGAQRAWRSIRVEWAIFGLAALLRLALLDLRPLHFDEGVNGYLVDYISREVPYRYIPTVGHGPLFFYAMWASEEVLGRNVTALRLSAAICSLVSVWLCFRFWPWIGHRGAAWAGFIMAISPSFTFVGRSAIPESLFCFFLLLLLWGVMRLASGPSLAGRWALATGAAGAMAVKETVLIHLAALMGAWLLSGLFRLRFPRKDFLKGLLQWVPPLASMAGLLWIIYTGAGHYPSALADFFRSFEQWTVSGVSQHTKPWWYWLYIAAHGDGMLLLGGVSGLLLTKASARSMRLAGWYSTLTLAAYFLIPYKTPWCIVSLAATSPLLAGVWAAKNRSNVRSALVFITVAVLSTDALTTTLRLAFWRHSDPEQPHVYVATSPEISQFISILFRHAEHDPRGTEVRGKVFAAEPHPLPWMLKAFRFIDYIPPGVTPVSFASGFILTDAARVAEVESQLTLSSYQRLLFHLRVDQPPCTLFLHKSVFRGPQKSTTSSPREP